MTQSEPPASGGVALLPCPFCGSDAELDLCEREGGSVFCTSPECSVGPETPFCKDVSKAIAAWNRRAPLAAAEMRERAARVCDEYAVEQAEAERVAQSTAAAVVGLSKSVAARRLAVLIRALDAPSDGGGSDK